VRRALVAVACSSLVVLLATACAPEDPAQRYVREQVEAHVATLTGYEAGRTHCTSTPRPWLVERATEVYICAARRVDGDCDWFTARLVGNEVDTTLSDRRAGCILPP
jgi:hypothetical protein